jgi:hypothetical protein
LAMAFQVAWRTPASRTSSVTPSETWVGIIRDPPIPPPGPVPLSGSHRQRY